ncbi:MAG: ABC transporter permease [Deltaproteobacteria bacterium]|nr:ABC transporter permease [Deltaproteobacteria bacterium]
MATRNLTRRPIQSLLASGAVAAGMTVCIWMTNFQDGSWISMLDDAMRASAGHVVVQADGYQESKESDLMLEGTDALAKELQALEPDGVVLRRMFIEGLLASPDNTVGIAVNAVEPDLEKGVNQISDKLVEGEWMTPGKRHVVIGKRLAEKLDVTVKNKVVLTLAADGEITGLPFRVSGIFETGNVRTDSFFALAPLDIVQQLLPERSEPATQVALQLEAVKAPSDLIERATAAVGGEGREVLTWQEALPEAVAAAKLDKSFTMFIWAVLAVIVSVGILNLLLMSLFQRTREMGVMMAVGMRPKDVLRLVVLEGAMLGLAGCIVGWSAGQLLTIPMVTTGIDLAQMQDAAPVSNVAIDTVIKSRFIWAKDFGWFAWFFVLTVLGALWPAVRAGRLSPVEALRHS